MVSTISNRLIPVKGSSLVNTSNGPTGSERFSLAAKWARKMDHWDNKTTHKILWKVAVRVVGVVVMFFALLADFFIHAFLALAKAIFALPAKPLHLCLKNSVKAKEILREFDFSSALVHTQASTQSIAGLITIPATLIFDSKRARYMTQRGGVTQGEMRQALKEQEQRLNVEHQNQINLIQKEAQQQAARQLEAANPKIQQLEEEKKALELSYQERINNLTQQLAIFQNPVSPPPHAPDPVDMNSRGNLETPNQGTQTQVKPINRTVTINTTPKGQNLSGDGVLVIFEDTKKTVHSQIQSGDYTLKSVTIDLETEKLINNEIYAIKTMVGQRLADYNVFVKMIIEYCEGYQKGISCNIDVDACGSFGDRANQIIESIKTVNDAEQQLEIFKAIFEKGLKPQNRSYQAVKTASLIALEQQAKEIRERAAASVKAENDKLKQERLKSITFIKVANLAMGDLDVTNQLILESDEGKTLGIENFSEFLKATNKLKQEIKNKNLKTNEDLPKDFFTLVSLVKKINEKYCRIYPLEISNYSKGSALQALSLIDVYEIVQNPVFLTNASKIIKSEFHNLERLDNLEVFQKFTSLIDAAKENIKNGTADSVELEKLSKVVALLNEGKYLASKTNSFRLERQSFKPN